MNRSSPTTMAQPFLSFWYGFHLTVGASVVASEPGWMLPVTFNPTSTRCPAPTTTRGTNDENFDTADPSVGFKLASSSTYTLPLSSTSVLGTLKIVCWPCVRVRAPQSIANETSTKTLVM